MDTLLPTSTVLEMCEMVVDCPHFTPDWTNAGYIVIRNQNIRDGRLDLTSPSFTHEADFKRRTHRARPRHGDIIITREAPMGEVCLVPADVDCCLGQRQVLLRPKPSVDARYLHIALQSPFVRHQIFWNEGTGSTVSNIRIPILEAIRIPRFGKAEAAIAAIIAALDDKIEINRRMNETLEASARALFRDWFIDFGPTRAKAEGRPAYLAPDLWSRFPDRLDDNGVPKSWEWSELGKHVINFDSKRVPVSGAERAKRQGPYPYYGATSVMDHVDDYLFDGVYVLVGEDGSVVREDGLAYTQYVSGRIWVNNHAHVLQGREAVSTEQVLLFFHHAPVQPFITGAVQLKLSQGRMNAMPFIDAGPSIAAAFGTAVAPLFKRMRANAREACSLAATRDALLPKLMTGEIRVCDAEALAE